MREDLKWAMRQRPFFILERFAANGHGGRMLEMAVELITVNRKSAEKFGIFRRGHDDVYRPIALVDYLCMRR